MPDTLTFDEPSHVYRLDGKRLPHVTEILDEVLGGGFNFLRDADSEWLKQRGKVLHRCAELIAQGKDVEGVDERIAGQVEAIREFFQTRKPEVIDTELVVVSHLYRYAGRLDLYCRFDGKRVIADWKGTLDEGRIMLQLAAYAIALDEGLKEAGIIYGLGIQARVSGKAKNTKLIDLRAARREWLAILSVYNIKRRLGIIKKEQHAN